MNDLWVSFFNGTQVKIVEIMSLMENHRKLYFLSHTCTCFSPLDSGTPMSTTLRSRSFCSIASIEAWFDRPRMWNLHGHPPSSHNKHIQLKMDKSNRAYFNFMQKIGNSNAKLGQIQFSSNGISNLWQQKNHNLVIRHILGSHTAVC
jgi:hypothetical protein